MRKKSNELLLLFFLTFLFLLFLSCDENKLADIEDSDNTNQNKEDNDFNDDDTFSDFENCPESKYYPVHAGYNNGLLPELYFGVQSGMFEEPIYFTIGDVTERTVTSVPEPYFEISIAGTIPVSEKYIEENNYKEDKCALTLNLRNFGKLNDESKLQYKKLKIDEKVHIHSNLIGDGNYSNVVTYYMESENKLLMAQIGRYGTINFKQMQIPLADMLPEFEINQDSADSYEVCKKPVDSATRESFVDFLFFPDVTVKCKKSNEMVKMKDGIEYSFCGFKFFITESVAVAKGIDDDGSVGYSGKSSYFTMYIVNEEILEK